VRDAALAVVVMGVCGCGKSSVGERLAREIGASYIEGDAFHPPENVARMAAGVPLTDADRQGWLETLAAQLAGARKEGRSLVLGCSALKRRYRDTLRSGAPELRFVHLHGERDMLAARMAARQGHYMPASLLDSQLATLEVPGADERAITLDAGAPIESLVQTALAQLQGSQGTQQGTSP
jgi:gluconokinase